jgi:hypothetical protein
MDRWMSMSVCDGWIECMDRCMSMSVCDGWIDEYEWINEYMSGWMDE